MSGRVWTMYLTVDHVIDGDTIKGTLDLGLGVWMRGISLRLAGIDTPELDTPNGELARDRLDDLVATGDTLRVESVHWDKYAGRIDAIAWTLTGDPMSLNEQMVATGLARPYDGRGPKPWNADGTRRAA